MDISQRKGLRLVSIAQMVEPVFPHKTGHPTQPPVIDNKTALATALKGAPTFLSRYLPGFKAEDLKYTFTVHKFQPYVRVAARVDIDTVYRQLLPYYEKFVNQLFRTARRKPTTDEECGLEGKLPEN